MAGCTNTGASSSICGCILKKPINQGYDTDAKLDALSTDTALATSKAGAGAIACKA
jgi:hypothetical protein